MKAKKQEVFKNKRLRQMSTIVPETFIYNGDIQKYDGYFS